MKKIKQLFDASIEQKSAITDQETINSENTEKILDCNKQNDSFKIPYMYESDWSVLETFHSERFITSPGITQTVLNTEWNIDLGEIPSYMIPFIKYNIIYKSEEDILELNQTSSYDGWVVWKDGVFYMQDNNLHLVASLKLVTTNPTIIANETTIDIQAKLMISFKNPNTYL